MHRYFLIIIAFSVLSCSGLNKYQNLPEVKAWEADIKQFEQLDKTENYLKEAIIFAGSSSIRLWSSLSSDMAPYPVIQRGYGGAKLSDLAVYAERIISPHPCKAIVLFIANDITGSDADKSPEEVARLFRVLIKTIRRSHPETPLFWIAVTPTKSRWAAWPEVQKANKLIRSICEKLPNTFFISTDFAFLDNAGKPMDELFGPDSLHLSEKGYTIWSELIKKELEKVIEPEKVEIIAHRGASFIAPENTIASANLAWKYGADAVEADIYLSKDNKIMVIHDSNTRRTSGNDYIVKETASDILRKLDVGSFKDEKYRGERIPFLEEIINTTPPDKELVIEIKCGSEILPYLKDMISTNEKGKKFVFISFDFNVISEAKKVFQEYPCYWLCSNAELLQKNILLIKAAGLEGISLNYNIIDSKIASQARLLNLELFTWTVDNPDEARRLISLGVRGITTNRPGWLYEQIYQN